MQKVSKLKKLGKNVISNTNIGAAGISSYYLPFFLNLFSFTHPLVTLCFERFFPFVLFERGSKSINGLWIKVFVKALPNIAD